MLLIMSLWKAEKQQNTYSCNIVFQNGLNCEAVRQSEPRYQFFNIISGNKHMMLEVVEWIPLFKCQTKLADNIH